MITFYTAGPWAERDKVKMVAERLRDEGYKVNSRWLDVPEEAPEGMTDEEYQIQQANHDLKDVVAADALMYVNTGYKSEGKATELGIAIAMLKPIIVVISANASASEESTSRSSVSPLWAGSIRLFASRTSFQIASSARLGAIAS